MADIRHVDLEAPLAGEWIEVDLDEVNAGQLEDMEAFKRVGAVLDVLSAVIVNTSLVTADLVVPEGMTPVRAALRRMKMPQMTAIVQGFSRVGEVPKAS